MPVSELRAIFFAELYILFYKTMYLCDKVLFFPPFCAKIYRGMVPKMGDSGVSLSFSTLKG